MPRTAEFDRKALADLVRKQRGVVTRMQALGCGMTPRVLEYRSGLAGPWQMLLPSVYLTHTGRPTDEEREIGALLYAGPRSVLTGSAALRRHDLSAQRRDTVDVLVPLMTQRADA